MEPYFVSLALAGTAPMWRWFFGEFRAAAVIGRLCSVAALWCATNYLRCLMSSEPPMVAASGKWLRVGVLTVLVGTLIAGAKDTPS
jgi:hypothetical protein